jgi:hypothetical protein
MKNVPGVVGALAPVDSGEVAPAANSGTASVPIGVSAVEIVESVERK